MAFCKNCGSELPEKSLFCPNCGTQTNEAEPQPAPEAAPLLSEAPFTQPEEAAAPSEETVAQPEEAAAQPEEAPLPEAAPLTQPEEAAAQSEETVAQPEEAAAQPEEAPLPEAAPLTLPEEAPLSSEEASLETQLAPAKKNACSGKRTAVIVAACIAVLAIVAAVLFFAKASTPDKLIASSLSRTFSSISSEKTESLLKNGSVTVSADLSKWDPDLLGFDELPLEVLFQLCFGDAYVTAQLHADYDEDTLVDISTYVSGSQFSVESEQLLSGCYGLDLTKLKENLPNSMFAPGKAYSIDEDLYNSLLQLADRPASDNESKKDMMEVLGRYWQLLLRSACEEGNAKKSGTDLTVGTETFKATAITLTLDENGLANILSELYDAFMEDEELRALLTELSATMSTAILEDYDSVEAAIDDLYTNVLNREDFEKNLKELRESDIALTPVFYIAKSGKQLAAFDLSFDIEGDTGSISLKLGENPASSKYSSLLVKVDGTISEIIFRVTEDTAASYKSEIVLQQDGEQFATLECDWNKVAGDYTLTLDDGWDYLTISGTLKKQESSTELTIRQFSDGYSTLNIDLTILLNYNEPAVNAPEFKEILTMTAADFDSLSNALYEGTEAITARAPALFEVNPSMPVGNAGSIIGTWDLAYEGLEGVLCFTFNEDGTGIFESYGESADFDYYTADGVVYITIVGSTPEEFQYAISDGILYMDIGGETFEFARK